MTVYEVQADGSIERVEVLPISLDSFAYEDDDNAPEDCPDCQGTAIGNPHVDGSRCSYCHGRGTIRRGE